MNSKKELDAGLCEVSWDAQRNDKWGYIRRYIQDSEECPISQTKMADFLKQNLGAALDQLEQMDSSDLDLNKEDVLINLKRFERALLLIPQRRIREYDASIVGELFNELVIRFYRILAAPEQTAENSLTCDWLVKNLDNLAEEPENVTAETLDVYLRISNMLITNGSNKIKVYLEDSIEALAHALVSAGKFSLAKRPWEYAIRLLSDETNFMISQRFDRMCAASDMYKQLYKSDAQETN